MRVMVTGAAGFLGRAVVEAAVGDHDVVAAVRQTHPAPWIEDAGARRHSVNLGLGPTTGPRNTKLQGALQGIEVVIHCAGRVRWGSRADYDRDNRIATEEVFDAARRAGVRRVVHVGSTAVYGDRAVERGAVSEDSPLGYLVSRLDRYTKSKIAAEEAALGAMGDGLEVVCVRPGWIIGPRDHTLDALARSLAGPVFPLAGGGRNLLAVTSVGSVASALLLAATRPEAAGRIYNVAQDEDITQRDFLEAVADAAGVSARLVPVPYNALYAGGFVGELVARCVPGGAPPLSRNAVILLGGNARIPPTRIVEELGWAPAAPIRAVIKSAFDPGRSQ